MKIISIAAAMLLAIPAYADTIELKDPYARASTPLARSGAAFMEIHNKGPEPDRLIGAQSESAMRVEIHTHIMEDGIARMRELEGGLELPAGEMTLLQRGGYHLMMMGLKHAFEHGKEVTVTLTFENADPITVTMPIDLERAP